MKRLLLIAIVAFTWINESQAVSIDSFDLPAEFALDDISNTVDPDTGGKLSWHSSYQKDSYNGMSYSGTVGLTVPSHQDGLTRSGGIVNTLAPFNMKYNAQVASSFSEVKYVAGDLWANTEFVAESLFEAYWSLDVPSYPLLSSNDKVPLKFDWRFDLYAEGYGGYGAIAEGFGAVICSGFNSPHYYSVTNDQTVTKTPSDGYIRVDQGSKCNFGLSAHTKVWGLNYSADFEGRARAIADPVVTIDPTWEFASLVSLTYNMPEMQGSGGAGIRSATVPEPTSLALLGIGLVGLGFSRKHKNNARD